jgi:hypothetical protein
MAVILNASTSSGFVQSADTSGEINLQSNGSTKLTVTSSGVTATNIQGTIVQGTAVASTSGTSIDFTGIPSWAKKVTVIYSGVSTNAVAALLVQIGDSGGIETTGYNSTFFDAITSTAGFVITSSNSAAALCTGKLEICLLNGNSWVATGTNMLTNSATYGSAGDKTLSATLDRVRITTVAGTATFDAGTINIQYEG